MSGGQRRTLQIRNRRRSPRQYRPPYLGLGRQTGLKLGSTGLTEITQGSHSSPRAHNHTAVPCFGLVRAPVPSLYTKPAQPGGAALHPRDSSCLCSSTAPGNGKADTALLKAREIAKHPQCFSQMQTLTPHHSHHLLILWSHHCPCPSPGTPSPGHTLLKRTELMIISGLCLHALPRGNGCGDASTHFLTPSQGQS